MQQGDSLLATCGRYWGGLWLRLFEFGDLNRFLPHCDGWLHYFWLRALHCGALGLWWPRPLGDFRGRYGASRRREHEDELKESLPSWYDHPTLPENVDPKDRRAVELYWQNAFDEWFVTNKPRAVASQEAVASILQGHSNACT